MSSQASEAFRDLIDATTDTNRCAHCAKAGDDALLPIGPNADLAFAGGVQRRLQFDVERTRANAAAVLWPKLLYVANRVQAKAFGDAGLHQFQDALNGGLGLLGRNEVEVALASRRAKIGHRALMDAMGDADDDPRRGGLSMAALPCCAKVPRRTERNTVAEGGNRRWAETARQNAVQSRRPRLTPA